LSQTSIALATPSVLLTVTGTDPNPGSGLAGGEFWIGSAPIAPGSGTPFTALTNIPVPTGSLTTGTYTVQVRLKDNVGNWGAARSVTLLVDTIFANGFEGGNNDLTNLWSSRSTNTASRLSVTAAAALVGANGLQAQGNNTNYVQYNFGTAANPATGTFDARFYFRPNGNGSTGQDIFTAATSNTFGTTLFRVRYRLNLGTPQVQIQVGTANTNTAWTNVTNASTRIEVVWQSGTSLALYVNGTLSQTLTAGAGSVGAFRLGSVTNGGSNILEYFDALSAKRSVSPLVGP
jgi:hypothetical protein